MATPYLTKHSLAGAYGDLLVDVRTGDRKNPRPAVVVIHGFKGFKDWGMFPPLAERLAKAGITAVSFNMSGSGVDDHGEFTRPGLFGRNTFSAELADLGTVASAVALGDALDLPPPSSLGLLGHSRGGGIAVLESAGNSRIAALVTWNAIGSVDRWSESDKAAWRRAGFVNVENSRTGQIIPLFTGVLDDIERNGETRLNIQAAAAKVAAPWLIVHAANDETVDVAEAHSLHGASPGECRLLVIPEAGHTFGATHPLKEVTPALDRAITETVGWFARYLR